MLAVSFFNANTRNVRVDCIFTENIRVFWSRLSRTGSSVLLKYLSVKFVCIITILFACIIFFASRRTDRFASPTIHTDTYNGTGPREEHPQEKSHRREFNVSPEHAFKASEGTRRGRKDRGSVPGTFSRVKWMSKSIHATRWNVILARVNRRE